MITVDHHACLKGQQGNQQTLGNPEVSVAWFGFIGNRDPKKVICSAHFANETSLAQRTKCQPVGVWNQLHE